jgi:hypothetical protein
MGHDPASYKMPVGLLRRLKAMGYEIHPKILKAIKGMRDDETVEVVGIMRGR